MTAHNQETYKVYFINPAGNEIVLFANKLDLIDKNKT
jgi:hypothetical protein